MRTLSFLLALGISWPLGAADSEIASWVIAEGGSVERDREGSVMGVDLTSTWVTDADMDRISRLSGLRKLILSHTNITGIGLERLKALANVQELSCYYAEHISDEGLGHLKGWRKLERLNLRGTKVTSKVFEHLAGLTNLKWLDVAYTEADDEGFDQLAALPHLDSLAFGGNRLSGAALGMLQLLPALKHLDVGGIQRVDSGLWGLALTSYNLEQIGKLTQLESLNLSGANLADRGLDRPGSALAERSELRDLSKLASLVNLRFLDLSRTPVSTQGLEVLRKLTKLRELRLGLATNVDDSSMPLIAALPELETLHLTGTNLTDKGLYRLREARRLKRLFIGGTNVTPAGVDDFRRAHPDCHIGWFGKGS